LLASPPLAGAHDSPAPHTEQELSGAQRQVIREATRQFRDVDTAIEAGYLPSEACAEAPGLGAMGYHFVNPPLIGDGTVDPALPEVLLYAPASSGTLRLVGVEYMVVDADQDLATDEDRPNLMGHAFEGPMEGHEPGMPVHYDLHAWVFTNNPDGNLASWNPAISCPSI
jgi:hypothetical protein